MTNKKLTLVLLLIWSGYASAQDPVFYQNDNAQVYNNPAFIGTCESASFDLTYRNQWPEISGNYITTAFSANQYLGKGNGVSLLYSNDIAANTLFTNRISLGYAKQFTISENHHFSIGVQTAFFQKKLDWGNLTFGDQIDPRRGFVYTTNQTNSGGISRGVDFNAGVLYYNNFLFGGVAVHHITEPNEGLISSAVLPRKYTLQLGGLIKIKDIVFIPAIQARNQGSFNSVIGSVKTRFNKIEVDLGYVRKNGPIGGIGLRFETWNIGYNFGASLSKISYFSRSTHEIRIGFRPQILKKTNDAFFDFF
jgi:type IX secretion system PorP/SprF family membrane protein